MTKSKFDWEPPEPLTLEEALKIKHVRPLIQRMLNTSKYWFFVKAVKAPLVKAIVALASKYPEPTYENVLKPNSHRLLNIQGEFLRCEHNAHTRELFPALFRLFIAEYEHDGYYARRIDKLIQWVMDSGWEFGDKMDDCWKETL